MASSTPTLEVKTEEPRKPVCLIILGMAGAGKTTFTRRLASKLYDGAPPYVVNLDPACREIPYHANIDIRDIIDYKEVMKQYKLGPNGGIIIALNLFSTKFGQVVELIEKAGAKHKYCVIDTPGQIEVFTWSASGTVVTEVLASSCPTVVVYVMDVAQSISPITFMSNMLYACSIRYKTRLPFVVVMNKVDVEGHDYAVDWMKDYETFLDALDENCPDSTEGGSPYIKQLTRSMALALDPFYGDLKCCGVSSSNGDGINDFFQLVDEAVLEYETEYKVDWLKMCEEKLQEKIKKEEGLKEDDKDDVTEKKSLIDEVPSGRDLSDIYLIHPGSESFSSSDEEGTDQEPEVDDNPKDVEMFRDFSKIHIKSDDTGDSMYDDTNKKACTVQDNTNKTEGCMQCTTVSMQHDTKE